MLIIILGFVCSFVCFLHVWILEQRIYKGSITHLEMDMLLQVTSNRGYWSHSVSSQSPHFFPHRIALSLPELRALVEGPAELLNPTNVVRSAVHQKNTAGLHSTGKVYSPQSPGAAILRARMRVHAFDYKPRASKHAELGHGFKLFYYLLGHEDIQRVIFRSHCNS